MIKRAVIISVDGKFREQNVRGSITPFTTFCNTNLTPIPEASAANEICAVVK